MAERQGTVAVLKMPSYVWSSEANWNFMDEPNKFSSPRYELSYVCMGLLTSAANMTGG